MKQHYYWLGHFFWMLGKIYLSVISCNWPNVVECWYWLRIHLTYKATRIGCSRLPWRIVINNMAIKLLGIAGTAGILYGLFIITQKIST